MDETHPLYKNYVYLRSDRILNVPVATANLKVQEIICTYEHKSIMAHVHYTLLTVPCSVRQYLGNPLMCSIILTFPLLQYG